MRHMHDAAYFTREAIKALERARKDVRSKRADNGLRHLAGVMRQNLNAVHEAHDAVAAEARKHRTKEPA